MMSKCECIDIVKEARELLEGVTPGPWTAITPEGYDGFAYIQFNSNNGYDSHITVYGIDESHPYCEQNRADLAFILRARTLVPELVELCKRLELDIALLNGRLQAEEKDRDEWKARFGEAVAVRLRAVQGSRP